MMMMIIIIIIITTITNNNDNNNNDNDGYDDVETSVFFNQISVGIFDYITFL